MEAHQESSQLASVQVYHVGGVVDLRMKEIQSTKLPLNIQVFFFYARFRYSCGCYGMTVNSRTIKNGMALNCKLCGKKESDDSFFFR